MDAQALEPDWGAVDRILGCHARAEREGIRGDWYGAQGLDVERSACVASALSPGVRWETVREGLPAVLDAIRGGLPIPGPFYGANKRKAVVVFREGLDGFDPKGAPKTYRFARNLLGDYSVVTVDRWAFRVCGLPAGGWARYRVAEASYIAAAEFLGEPPALVQARCWEFVRGSA